MPIIGPGGGGGGGSQPATATATLTLNRAGSFAAQHDFDLGDTPNVLQLTFTMNARVADGETWGETGSDIFVELAGILSSGLLQLSDDGSTWVSLATTMIPRSLNHGSTTSPDVVVAVNDRCGYVLSAFRYLRVAVAIFAADTFDVYAGANNPTAAIGVNVRYVT